MDRGSTILNKKEHLRAEDVLGRVTSSGEEVSKNEKGLVCFGYMVNINDRNEKCP